MKLVLAEPKYLTESVSIISELVNEVTLKIQKNKIDIIAMDPANVAMTSFSLLSSAFAEYQVDESKNLSINLEQFKQVLKRAKSSDTITLSSDEKKNKLKIKIVGNSTRTFDLALLNLDEKEPKIPDLSFSVKVTTGTSFFDEAIEDMSIISDALSLTVEKDKFYVDSTSNLHAAKVELSSNEETSIEVNTSSVSSKYSVEYLKKMIKASKLTNKVQIQFDKDYPLRLDYLVKDKMNLSFILAPRVSD